MTVEPIALPLASDPPRRGPIPILAAIVPVGAGVALWLITGSLFALCFAALGPLMMIASMLDARRLRKREMRLFSQRDEDAWARADRLLSAAHESERARLRRQGPDAADCLHEPPLRTGALFSPTTTVTIGRGSIRSDVRVTGGEGTRAEEFRARAARVEDAPIVVDWGGGVCVRGQAVLVDAVARALLVQLCLRFGPRQVSMEGEALASLGIDAFAQSKPRKGVPSLAVLRGQDARTDAPMHLRLLQRGEGVPDGITTVIEVVEPARSEVRTASGSQMIAVECLSYDQALVIAHRRAGDEAAVEEIPDAVALDTEDSDGVIGSLRAMLGRTASESVHLDLVADGPHAVVTGMTGTGKSELLVSWVVSMATGHSPEQVIFVLADFKGGTAFDPLRELPHVVAVMTDLDEEDSRRGVQSLTAELRRREGALAAAGAREISETTMPRLVIVVDEFAALLQEHPDLAAVFTDIAARGRALGMHLILGTQRASGVVRDALAANCPLRISLRVTESADSRAVIGTDDAAEISGGPLSRGLAFIRRPQDGAPVAVRIARTTPRDVNRARTKWEGARTSQSPWLPPLPARLELPEAGLFARGTVALGVADEPERQKQEWVTLRIGADRGLAFLGGSSSGKSSLIRTLHSQAPEAMVVPHDPEHAWDLTERLVNGDLAPAFVLCDDLDALLDQYPLDYAHLFVQRWERIVRAGTGTVVVTAAKVASGVGRVIDALPDRALLRMANKLDHLAQGGEADGFQPGRPAGRARMRGKEVQLAWVPEHRNLTDGEARGTQERAWGDDPSADGSAFIPFWLPVEGTSGIITSDSQRLIAALRVAHPLAVVVRIAEEDPQADAEDRAGRVRILVGDGEDWQRHWALFRALRGKDALVVAAECATELRSMLAIKELPPYARTYAGRAWQVRGGRATRVRLPVEYPGSRTSPLSLT